MTVHVRDLRPDDRTDVLPHLLWTPDAIVHRLAQPRPRKARAAPVKFAASGLAASDPRAAAAAENALDALELLAREGDFKALLA